MSLAMKNFLNKQASDIVFDLQDSLQGNMREIIGTLSLRDICNNRDEFGNQVQTKAKVDMEKLGIEIISCNIQSIADKNGLIVQLKDGQVSLLEVQKQGKNKMDYKSFVNGNRDLVGKVIC